MPHIGIDDSGEVGAISRPGRPKVSHACGALLKALSEVKADGIGRNFGIPGERGALAGAGTRWHTVARGGRRWGGWGLGGWWAAVAAGRTCGSKPHGRGRVRPALGGGAASWPTHQP